MALIQQTNPAVLPRYFYGFSTLSSGTTGIRTLYDIDLINVDLMNSFNTLIGERVMRPDWGCALWNYVMEPLTAVNTEAIIAETTRIIHLDSRCVVLSVQVLKLMYGFRIECVLKYLPWNQIATFAQTFEANNTKYFSGDGLTP
jgi:phage baseplate assembly protein W